MERQGILLQTGTDGVVDVVREGPEREVRMNKCWGRGCMAEQPVMPWEPSSVLGECWCRGEEGGQSLPLTAAGAGFRDLGRRIRRCAVGRPGCGWGPIRRPYCLLGVGRLR